MEDFTTPFTAETLGNIDEAEAYAQQLEAAAEWVCLNSRGAISEAEARAYVWNEGDFFGRLNAIQIFQRHEGDIEMTESTDTRTAIATAFAEAIEHFQHGTPTAVILTGEGEYIARATAFPVLNKEEVEIITFEAHGDVMGIGFENDDQPVSVRDLLDLDEATNILTANMA